MSTEDQNRAVDYLGNNSFRYSSAGDASTNAWGNWTVVRHSGTARVAESAANLYDRSGTPAVVAAGFTKLCWYPNNKYTMKRA